MAFGSFKYFPFIESLTAGKAVALIISIAFQVFLLVYVFMTDAKENQEPKSKRPDESEPLVKQSQIRQSGHNEEKDE